MEEITKLFGQLRADLAKVTAEKQRIEGALEALQILYNRVSAPKDVVPEETIVTEEIDQSTEGTEIEP